jgi:hypothetical protein
VFSGDGMSWSLVAALFMMSGPQAAPAVASAPSSVAVQPQAERPTMWHLAMRVTAPMTTTDPQHVGVSLGVGRAGFYRGAIRYQPSETEALGFVSGAAGLRLMQSEHWTIAVDAEHTRIWSARKLYESGGFQFQGHDRRWITLGVVSAMSSERRWAGVIDGFEVGGGRMVIRESVAGRLDGDQLNADPVLVLKTAAAVGMMGVTLSRPLRWGFSGNARIRLIAAGRSRGGTVPFAQATAEWEIARTIFTSQKYGRGQLGVSGNHATSSKAAVYYQNGLGLSLRISF